MDGVFAAQQPDWDAVVTLLLCRSCKTSVMACRELRRLNLQRAACSVFNQLDLARDARFMTFACVAQRQHTTPSWPTMANRVLLVKHSLKA